jgi:hypothetical protein
MGGALLRPGMTRIWHDLFFFPFFRSAAVATRAYHRAAVDPIGAIEDTRFGLNLPALVRFPAEPGLRLAPGAKF